MPDLDREALAIIDEAAAKVAAIIRRKALALLGAPPEASTSPRSAPVRKQRRRGGGLTTKAVERGIEILRAAGMRGVNGHEFRAALRPLGDYGDSSALLVRLMKQRQAFKAGHGTSTRYYWRPIDRDTHGKRIEGTYAYEQQQKRDAEKAAADVRREERLQRKADKEAAKALHAQKRRARKL